MNQLKKYYLPLSFLLLISLPLLNWGGWILKFKRENENRIFNDSLRINLNQLDKFPAAFESYYNDNFPFRAPLLKFYHLIKFKIFKVSPNPEELLIGKDGWYFFGGKEQRIFEGRENFNSSELELFASEWQSRMKYLQSKNIKAYWLICPIKQSVYADKLPDYIKKPFREKRTDKLKKYLNAQVPELRIIDPTQHLISLKEKEKLYFKLDNHWNLKAGWEITNYLLHEFKKEFPLIEEAFLNDFTWKIEKKQDGIHKATLGLNELFENVEVIDKNPNKAAEIKKYGFVSPSDFPYDWKYELRYQNSKNGKYRILIIRDSFGDAIVPFLKEPFQESVFIFDNWKYALNKEIIEKVNPDIILYLTLETHLDNLIK